MIVGICGKKGSGKTTAAKAFMKAGYEALAFADTLKEASAEVFNIPLSVLQDPVAKDRMELSIELSKTRLNDFIEHLHKNYAPISPAQAKAAIEAYKGPDMVTSPRQLLQILGTDLIRLGVGDNYWISALESKIKPNRNYVVHDVRFQNEADLIRNKLIGKLLIVDRPGRSEVDSHVSEQFKPIEYDYYINNYGGLAEFNRSINDVIRLIEYENGKKESRS